MRKELHYFDIFPKAVPANQESEVVIRFLEPRFFQEEGCAMTIAIVPLFESNEHVGGVSHPEVSEVYRDGCVRFSHRFGDEQEYFIRLYLEPERYIQLSVYALEPDLYGRRPLKGDLHSHTTYSDGSESPESVIAYYRMDGFDFTVISDHYKYEGAQAAQAFYKDVKTDFHIVSGEEVHAPDNHIHIVNFGGNFSVNRLYQEDEAGYRRDVTEIMARTSVPEGINAFEYASCLWITEKIRAGGGLSIYAHPHWLSNAYHVRDTMTRWMFEHPAFDVFELLGGQTQWENNMQIAIYQEHLRRGGADFPVVGSSDSHGVVRANGAGSSYPIGEMNPFGFGDLKTIVFAKQNTTPEIIDAVRNRYCSPVSEYKGEAPQAHGDYRMASYTLFLLREYFPLHDALCVEEGRLMKEMAARIPGAAEELSGLYGRTERLMCRYFPGIEARV